MDDVIIVSFDQAFFGFTLPSRMKLPSLIPLGSMGLVYLPTNFTIQISHSWIGKYINHMDPMPDGVFVSHIRKMSSKPEAREMFREVLDGTLKEMVEP